MPRRLRAPPNSRPQPEASRITMRLSPAMQSRRGGRNYYRAFQYWRLAAIVEGVLSRDLKGAMGNKANTDVFKKQVDSLADSALRLVRSD